MTSTPQGRRPQAAGIAADTPIQKVLHPTIADLYATHAQLSILYI